MDLAAQRTPNALLKYAMGCLFSDKSTPNPFPEASASTTNGVEKFGNPNTRAFNMASVRTSKAVSDSLSQ